MNNEIHVFSWIRLCVDVEYEPSNAFIHTLFTAQDASTPYISPKLCVQSIRNGLFISHIRFICNILMVSDYIKSNQTDYAYLNGYISQLKAHASVLCVFSWDRIHHFTFHHQKLIFRTFQIYTELSI